MTPTSKVRGHRLEALYGVLVHGWSGAQGAVIWAAA